MPRTTRVRKHRRKTSDGVTRVVRHDRTLDLPNAKERRSKYKYNVHIEVVVPSTRNKTIKISEDEFEDRIRETQHMMTRLFGGHTTVEGQGGYYSQDLNEEIEEDVVIVSIYTERSAYLKNDMTLRNWLKQKRIQWGQESIMFTYEAPGFPLRSFLITEDSG